MPSLSRSSTCIWCALSCSRNSYKIASVSAAGLIWYRSFSGDFLQSIKDAFWPETAALVVETGNRKGISSEAILNSISPGGLRISSERCCSQTESPITTYLLSSASELLRSVCYLPFDNPVESLVLRAPVKATYSALVLELECYLGDLNRLLALLRFGLWPLALWLSLKTSGRADVPLSFLRYFLPIFEDNLESNLGRAL